MRYKIWNADDDGKLMGEKRTEQQRERLICSRYYTFTEPALPHRLAHQENKHQENINLDFLPPAIITAPYQCKSVSSSSYLQESHTGARRRAHKAQSVSDNGAEGAWPTVQSGERASGR
jgi:hypothetical protein